MGQFRSIMCIFFSFLHFFSSLHDHHFQQSTPSSLLPLLDHHRHHQLPLSSCRSTASPPPSSTSILIAFITPPFLLLLPGSKFQLSMVDAAATELDAAAAWEASDQFGVQNRSLHLPPLPHLARSLLFLFGKSSSDHLLCSTDYLLLCAFRFCISRLDPFPSG